MSTRSSLFLTQDNEHCYSDCSESENINGKRMDPIYLELSKNNIEIVTNDEDDLIIRFRPGTEIYNMIMRMDDYRNEMLVTKNYK